MCVRAKVRPNTAQTIVFQSPNFLQVGLYSFELPHSYKKIVRSSRQSRVHDRFVGNSRISFYLRAIWRLPSYSGTRLNGILFKLCRLSVLWPSLRTRKHQRWSIVAFQKQIVVAPRKFRSASPFADYAEKSPKLEFTNLNAQPVL